MKRDHAVLLAAGITLGAWTVGVLADWAAMATGRVSMQVGDIALAIGLAGALLSALAGFTDFHDTFAHERRTALTHGLTMTAVIVIEAVSLGLRWSGSSQLHLAAVVLASGGYLLALAGAYVGGHLAFGLGTMVNHNAFADGPADYVAIGASSRFKESSGPMVSEAGVSTSNVPACAVLVYISGVKLR